MTCRGMFGHARISTTSIYLHVRPSERAAEFMRARHQRAEGEDDAARLAACIRALPAEARDALRALLVA